MENNKNKQTAPEAAAALPDDALGEVTGGSAEHTFEEAPASYKEASDALWMKEYNDYKKKP